MSGEYHCNPDPRNADAYAIHLQSPEPGVPLWLGYRAVIMAEVPLQSPEGDPIPHQQRGEIPGAYKALQSL